MSGWSIVYIEGSQLIIPSKYCISFSGDHFFSKQYRPDEMPHSVAFHLGLYFLQKYLLRVSSLTRVHLCKTATLKKTKNGFQ